MDLIGSTACDHVNLAARAFSKFGAVAARLDLELLDCVHRRASDEDVLIQVSIDGSIQQEAVLFGTHASDRNAAAGDVAGSVGCSAVAFVDAREQQAQLHEIAAVKREVYNLLLVHYGSDRGLFGLQ